MRRSKKSDDKTKGIIIGVIVTLAAVVLIGAVSVSSAHAPRDSDASDMMNGGMMVMHGMMMGSDPDMDDMHDMMDDPDIDGMHGSGMGCMSMMHDHDMAK